MSNTILCDLLDCFYNVEWYAGKLLSKNRTKPLQPNILRVAFSDRSNKDFISFYYIFNLYQFFNKIYLFFYDKTFSKI